MYDSFLALLQMMMSQMSPGHSQNISVAGAPEREEKVDDDGEKQIEAVEEVEAVNLCSSKDEKAKTKNKEIKNQKNKIVHVKVNKNKIKKLS